MARSGRAIIAVVAGAAVWAVLRALGRDGVADLVDGFCDHAAAFAARYVIEGHNGHAHETFNGLEGLAESDRVHVVVRPASAG
mgnify:CR=1 FL=1